MSRERGSGGGLLGNREYAGLLVAQVTSEAGDQLAKLALALLVYARTANAFYAALAYVVAFLPPLLGGALLGSLADRLPRRRVLVGCDLVRAATVAVMALPGVPLPALFVLLFLVSLPNSAFDAARSALLPEVLGEDPDRYARGMSLSRVVHQLDQGIGFVVGGVLVAATTPRGALLVDAVSFLVSAGVLRACLVERPAAVTAPAGRRVLLADLRDSARAIAADPARRSLLLLAWTAGLCLIAPEGLAVTYAALFGGGEVAAGVLTAAAPAGAVVGVLALTRWVPARRQVRLVPALATGSMLFLAATAARPPLPVAVALWFGSGLCQAFMVPTIATFNLTTPPAWRGRANGLAGSGLVAAQALGLGVSGAVAVAVGPEPVVAFSGVLGLALLALLRPWWPAALRDGAPEPAVPAQAAAVVPPVGALD